MASKSLPDEVLDLILDDIANNGDLMCLCSAQPTTYAEATVAYKLADEVLVTGYVASDYSKGVGTPDGRALTIADQTNILIDAGGVANHIAIVDTLNSKLKAIVTTAAKTLTAGKLADVSSFKINPRAPT